MTTRLKAGDRIKWTDVGLKATDVVDEVTDAFVVTKGGMLLDHDWAERNVTVLGEEPSLTYTADDIYARHEPKDDVYHPPHYARWKMEPIEFIAINDLPWWLANVIKYTMRFDAKDGLQDLRKARSYLDMKIREVEGVQRFWDKPVTEERAANGKV